MLGLLAHFFFLFFLIKHHVNRSLIQLLLTCCSTCMRHFKSFAKEICLPVPSLTALWSTSLSCVPRERWRFSPCIDFFFFFFYGKRSSRLWRVPPLVTPAPLWIREEIHLLFYDRITETTHATTFRLALTYKDTTYPPETYKLLRSLLLFFLPRSLCERSSSQILIPLGGPLWSVRFGDLAKSESWKVNHSGRRVTEHEVKTTNTPAKWSHSPRTRHLWERHWRCSARINPKMFSEQILSPNTSITIYLCQ